MIGRALLQGSNSPQTVSDGATSPVVWLDAVDLIIGHPVEGSDGPAQIARREWIER